MGSYLLRRTINYIILLFIAISLSYFLAASALNPRSLYLVQNPPLNPLAIESILRSKNLSDNVPLLQRYWTWLTDIVLHWNWGQGAGPLGGPVNDEIGRRIWVSLRLVGIGSILGMIGGIALGAWSATKQYTLRDRTATGVSLLIFSMPTVVVAVLTTIIATQINNATGVRIFEFLGETGARGDYPGAGIVDRAQHLVLPSLVLILFAVATFSRIQRNLMLDTLGADFVRTARAKGLRRQKAVMKHALRTSLIPVATYFAFSVAQLFTGSVFVERIFNFHGMGEYGVSTITGQDPNGTVGVVAFSGVCVLTGAVLSDVLVAILDPRVRVS